MGDLIRVDFNGDELAATREPDGRIYVSVKRVCEALGLDFGAQHEKLKTAGWATVLLIRTVGEDGRNREHFCLLLDDLPTWLVTIQPSRVRPDVRAKLVRYQCDARDVLARHFLGEVASPAAALVPERDKLAVTLDLAIERLTSMGDGLVFVRQEVTEVKEAVEFVKGDVADLRRTFAANMPRAHVTIRVRRTHTSYWRDVLGCRCPHCHSVTESVEIDHWFGNGKRELYQTWPICQRCNRDYGWGTPRRNDMEPHFRAYQLGMHKWLAEQTGNQGALFQ